MEHLPTLDRHTQEHRRKQEPGRRSWRNGLIWFVIFLAAYGLDWAAFGHEASRTQKEIERMLADFPLPPATSQVGYKTKYLPNRGYAERTLASTASTQEIC